MKRKLLFIVLLLVLVLPLQGCSLYEVVFAITELNSGPDFLYENEDKVLGGSNETSLMLPGASFVDTDGNVIEAHGGQIQWMSVPAEDGGTRECYVWVGEDKRSGHTGNSVAVYTSEDLVNWQFEGDVLQPVPSLEAMEGDEYFKALYGDLTAEEKEANYEVINPDAVIERPKMLYNETTRQYVIWFHSDNSTESNPDYKYDVGMSGVAVSDSPFGPFRLLGRTRLSYCPDDEIDFYPSSKGEARDMNLFKDDDGTGYIVYTSENNKTIYISKLNESYTGLATPAEEAVQGVDFIRIFPGAMREAPALIKVEGRYYLVTSSTTGWSSNEARVWVSDEILGDYINLGNPCVGEGSKITFDTQSTCVFQTQSGQILYLGDRWNGSNLSDSRYIFLPVTIEDGRFMIIWTSQLQFEP